jgi:uncharacterized membrane protein
MKSALRKSTPARIAALGFIVVVIFGNLRLTYALLGRPVSSWMQNGFALGVCLTLIGAVCLLALGVHLKIQNKDAVDAEGLNG